MKSFLRTGIDTFSFISGIKLIFPKKNFSSVRIERHLAPAVSYFSAIFTGSNLLHKIPWLGEAFFISAIRLKLLLSFFFKLDKNPLNFLLFIFV